METFLTASKSALTKLFEYSTIRIVLGNQSCDLDSAVCALAQGFCEYLNEKKKNKENVAVIPILNVTKKEFRIKTEVIYYFRQHGISYELLTFRDEIDPNILKGYGNKIEVVLVDHHVLGNDDMTLVNSVVEIIDHHPQDASWPWHGKTIHLDLVGSCATLVAHNLLIKHPESVDAWLANFLRGPILLDTCKFSKEANRTTSLDREIMETLERISSLGSDRDQIYQGILTAKTDISELTPDDLVLRDLKFESNVPFIGLPILIKDFLTLEGAIGAVEKFTESRKCMVAILMGIALKNDHVTRDIAVFSLLTNGLENKIINALLESSEPPLELTLEKRIEEEKYNLFYYKQGNVCASRKQILPIVRETLSKDRDY
ncbi:PREDICTED: protein prune homolog isoform X1 [Polistes canadensis]|uniref:protein prune homolog isoform X1 n=1 Tax=Polistes canadensis TaxID=91411 RepID=UPI000718C515|nr:PREDICTED: protein prune homolog isoform X1 [Polistes canadensis]